MSMDSYYKQFQASGNKTVDEEKKKRLEEDAALKQQVTQNIDTAADAAAGVYQQEIEQAPLDSRALYDQNAMREAIDRKKIQESLANMGMTDSGLSSSMQTALTVQKSRADNAVRANEGQRIRAAESAIDQIWANAHMQKAEQHTAIDQATAEWERNARLSVDANAQQQAAAAYKADVEAASEQQKMAMDIHNKRAAMAQSYIKDGKSVSEAWGQAYYAYPDASTTEGIRYASYNQLIAEGYGNKAADAMATAYVNAVMDGKTENEVSKAVNAAMTTAWEAEIASAGINLYGDDARRNANKPVSVDRIKNTAAVYAGAGLSPDATAYAVGKAYFDAVVTGDDDNAEQVGKALAQCFGGMQLRIALDAAGLEYTAESNG